MLTQGYPMDGSPVEWYAENSDKFTEVALTFGGEELLESDVAQFAWKDNVTPQMRKFFEQAGEMSKDLAGNDVLMQSMHSGSSDYLYVKNIRKWLASNY